MRERSTKLVGEFLVIVVGVLAALAVDDYRDVRADRTFEAHLLSGIRADLERDTVDAGAVIRAAQGRAAAADEILAMLGDPVAGRIQAMAWNLDQHLIAARELYAPGSVSQGVALLLLADQRRLDLSDASFSQAIASGRLDVIGNLELRSAIATHYFNARRYERADERVEAASQRLRDALGMVGLSLSDAVVGSEVVELVRGSPQAVAELKNAREFALRQAEWNTLFMQSAQAVLAELVAASER
ncbi:MAG: hypothetical protein O2958_13120 [Gemmatimonadetes bacterium]|nr:hypothetical protein [Gemmatimonadota bacterium]MDA1104285.1 hypothetical protein [Gemmatimonadota bacterium]